MGKWVHRITKNTGNRTGVCSNCGTVRLNINNRCLLATNENSRILKLRKKYGQDISLDKPVNCELCNGTTRIAYDHCHKTGKFRGWLCMKCNTALGLVNDDIELLQKMIKYLSK